MSVPGEVPGGTEATWTALRERAGILVPDRALVVLRGGDTADLLHRVTSQDANGMATGDGAAACILTGKGKLLAYFELFRLADDVFVAEVDAARRTELYELIDRFLFAEQIELEVPDLAVAGVFGPAVPELLDVAPSVAVAGGGYRLVSSELGVPGVRLHAPPAEVDAWLAELASHDLLLGGVADYDALRIDAGRPRYGVDAGDTTIPLEVGLDHACHPDKGCYIGQEIIARIHTYGHVNRKLCRVTIESDTVPDAGTRLYDEDGDEAGRITSGYAVPGKRDVRALAMLPRVLAEAGTELRFGAADGPRATVQ